MSGVFEWLRRMHQPNLLHDLQRRLLLGWLKRVSAMYSGLRNLHRLRWVHHLSYECQPSDYSQSALSLPQRLLPKLLAAMLTLQSWMYDLHKQLTMHKLPVYFLS